ARRPAGRLGALGSTRARGPGDAGRGGAADRPPQRLAHRPGRRADQGGVDREGVRDRAERAPRVGRDGDPRARRPARRRRPGGAAPRAAPVALHDRPDAALRRRHERGPAPHHRPARARAAAEVAAMWLAPTTEQQAVQDEARRFLAAEIGRERRLAWDRTAEGYDSAFWQAVAGLGWLGFGLPPAYGGHGASLLDVGLLVEELGRAVA